MFTARDGKQFSNSIAMRRYEGWLDSKEAPGGPAHVQSVKEHGAPRKITIEREPHGRHRITAEHPDGFKSTVVHGSNEAAHSVLADLLDVNPPISQHPERNAGAHPFGEGERRRMAHEDGRDEGGLV